MTPDAYVRPSGYDEWAAVCAKHYGDDISAVFCGGIGPPPITSLVELEELLQLRNFSETAFMLNGHSTGIGLRSVTPLNPRAFLMRSSPDFKHYRVLAFARGEPFVELVSNDPEAQTLRFFLIRFHLPCESTAAGCNSADLLTPTIESGWTSYTIEDDEALAGSQLDCLVCHQPEGPGTRKILRMQEKLGPWTHWFGNFGQQYFNQMHGTAGYAGHKTGDLNTSPGGLQSLLDRTGFGDQPNAFVSQTIKNELQAMGTSPTWQVLYENAVAGRMIPPPYFGEDQTDPAKRDAFITAYKQVVAGTLPGAGLPDIRSIMLESALPAMSIRPKPGLNGRGILVHMCSQCHNSRLDQTKSRANFNVMTLDQMSRAEKDLAIQRLELPDTDLAKMPPPRFRTLSEAERKLAIDELAR